jgi:hypothetical protein
MDGFVSEYRVTQGIYLREWMQQKWATFKE